jgi:hypothetical protein
MGLSHAIRYRFPDCHDAIIYHKACSLMTVNLCFFLLKSLLQASQCRHEFGFAVAVYFTAALCVQYIFLNCRQILNCFVLDKLHPIICSLYKKTILLQLNAFYFILFYFSISIHSGNIIL